MQNNDNLRIALGCCAVLLLALPCVSGPVELLHLSFDEGFDGVSPQGVVKAVATGNVKLMAGRTGMALSVSETGACEYPSAGVLRRDAGALEMWVRPSWDSADGRRHALLTTGDRAVKVFKHTNSHLYCQVDPSVSKAGALSVHGEVRWRPGEWRRVVIAWRGMESAAAEAVVAIHVDGLPLARGSRMIKARAGDGTFLVGSDIGRFPFDGAIDEVRFFSAPTIDLEHHASMPLPDGTPTSDPYVASTGYLPAGAAPDPLHRLDRIQQTTWGGFPKELAEEYFGNSAAQRVVYRDTVTGAEVWLLLRSLASESILYTNYRPFNANGALIRVWGISSCLGSDGSELRSFRKLIGHEFSGLPEWDKTDPDVVKCRTANGGTYTCNLRTRERRDLYVPDPAIPPRTHIHFSDDRAVSMFITRQGGKPPFWFYLGDSRGENRRELPVKSISPTPGDDRMGSSAFLRDQHGVLYARYSLNKGKPGTGPTPYQNWLVDLDGKQYRRMDSHNNLEDGAPLHFIPAGTYTVTGHGGYSPSMKYFVHHKGRPGYKWIRDLRTWTQRDIARIPGCDHMDWTVSENWFFVWANQVGLPIYKTYIDTGVVERIVATNSCPHEYSACPYHGASPDGTKLLFKSSMLGNLDLYMAMVRPPEPPVGVTVKREGNDNLLAWRPPPQAKEIARYRVYRSALSGSGYTLRTEVDSAGELVWRDAEAPATAHYVLTSVEHCGLEGRVFSEEAAATWDGPVSRYWEAENGALTYPMREVFLPASCSANHAVTRAVLDPFWQPAAGEAAAAWRVNLPEAGRYTLWARVRSRDVANSAMPVSINGKSAGSVSTSGEKWHWAPCSGGPHALAAGTQNIQTTMPQPGLELDKLLLTTDTNLTPAGMGNTPLARPPKPEGLTVEWDKTGEYALLRWEGTGQHHFQVYRGNAASLEPEQANLIGSPTRPAFVDAHPNEPGDIHYRVIAVNDWGLTSELSDAARLPAQTAGDPFEATLELETATLSGAATCAPDKDATGGKCVAFGKPDELPEYAGEAVLPLDLEPGRYFLWLRTKGSPLKSAAFFWVTLGATEHYSRMYLTSGAGQSQWQWRRVTFLNSVRDPQARAMGYEVTGQNPVLKIKHRANYLAVDSVFIASSRFARPVEQSKQYHPGCSKAFKR